MKKKIDIIDTHAYIGVQPLAGMEIHPGEYRDLRRDPSVRGYDIRFLLMSSSLQCNRDLPGIVNSRDGAFLGGIAQINPNEHPKVKGVFGHMPAEELDEIISKSRRTGPGIVGLKNNTAFTCLKVDDAAMLPFADIAIKYDMPIIFHCSSTGQDFVHPDYLRNLLGHRPDLKVVLAHFGGLNENYWPESVRLAKEYRNVHLNTAGLSGQVKRRDKDSMKVISQEMPNDRWVEPFVKYATDPDLRGKIVFGSDYPELMFLLHPIDHLPEDTQREIFYDNAVKLFGLKPRNAAYSADPSARDFRKDGGL